MKRAVLISCFDWYRARLEPIREILIEKDYEVTVLEADFDHLRKVPIENRYPGCTYIHVPEYKSNISIRRILSHLSFGRQVGKILGRINPDLVYCLVPPNNVANECRKYKERHPNTKFILDIIDLWPESLPLDGVKNTMPARKWKKLRDDSIQVADHVFTECDLYQEKLNFILSPEKTTTLYLYKEQCDAERQLVRKIIGQNKIDDIIRFAYLGSINNIIDIDGICEVIKHFMEAGNKCELHAIGDGESKEEFEKAVHETGCKTYFYGPIFDELEKIKILAPCDYAFNMMKGNISVGLTIKSIDYLSYGLPLINNIKGDTWKLVEREGIGANADERFTSVDATDHSNVLEVYNNYFSKEKFMKSVSEVI